MGEILAGQKTAPTYTNLLVGTESSDDAAVFDIGDGRAMISTTDFFMPIVDDAYDFGRIASCNAISDVYAMGGQPTMAIAILGWPINKLPAAVASQVMAGARAVCAEAGIPLAGGHSIDAPEPIFGLAVSGLVEIDKLKRNDQARPGDKIFLTKPLGIGILTTAQKKGKISAEDMKLAVETMSTLNKIGGAIATLEGVNAMTDVTGFGLAGHLLEVCRGANVRAELELSKIPILPQAENYRQQDCIPGGTYRNHQSFGEEMCKLTDKQVQILFDPQTSGGLLVTVSPAAQKSFLEFCSGQGLDLQSFGEILDPGEGTLIRLKNSL